MNYVTIAQGDTGKITFPLSSYGTINPQLAAVLTKNNFPHLLHHKICNDGVQLTGIEIDVANMPALKERLTRPFSAKNLTSLFAQLQMIIVSCSYHSLPFMNVVMDPEFIYLANNNIDSLRFIYLPVAGKMRNISFIKEFFQSLAQEIKAEDTQAKDLLMQYSNFVSAQQNLNLSALANVLGTLAKTPITPAQPISSNPVNGGIDVTAAYSEAQFLQDNPGTTVLNAVDFEAMQEEESANQTEKPSQETAQNTSVPEQAPTPQPEPTPEPAPVQQPVTAPNPAPAPAPAPTPQPTSNPVPAPTSAPQLESEPEINYPNPKHLKVYRLTHKATGSNFDITGNDFKVGKSKRADLQVKNTTTVSRIHARFSCENDGCYIQDNKSLNGTFINENQMAPGEKRLLQKGDVIRMSDEEFVFEIVTVN